MEKTEITKVTPADIHQLIEISRQTFYETFSAANTEENMRKYLDKNLSVEKLTSELNNENSAFYFALFHNQAIGYKKLNTRKAQTDLKDEKALEIERIYVLKEFHGKAAGQLLCEKAIQVARQINAGYM